VSLRAYQTLPTLRDFAAAVDPASYAPVPPGWVIVLADVRGSTRAIEDGRYRDVNRVGAMVIAAAKNTLGTLDFPWIFGGDGATLVLPPDAAAALEAPLRGVISLAASGFGLTLRVGVAAVRPGDDLGMARYALTGALAQPLLRGARLAEAEAALKAGDLPWLTPGDASATSLEGLSCRWQPVASQRGQFVSVLCEADDVDAYREVLASVRGTQGEPPWPLEATTLRYHTVGACLADERRQHVDVRGWSWIRRVAEIVIAVAIFRWGVPSMGLVPRGYAQAMVTHTDRRKFDGVLRMVLDLSAEEDRALRSVLDRLRAERRLRFGLARSTHAMMTCLVDALEEGRHVHFLDGCDGGYAEAARALKSG
jgi:hypothetical protein